MSKRSVRIRSIDCPRKADDSGLTFNVALHEPCATPTPVKLEFTDPTGSTRDYGTKCQVSFNDGRSYQPVNSGVVQVPVDACGFKVRVDPPAPDPVASTPGQLPPTPITLAATCNGVTTQGSGTACNPVSPPVGVRSVSCAQQVEGEPLSFDVALSGSARSVTRVQLSVGDASAQAGSDYSPALKVSFDNGKTWASMTGPAVDVPAGACGFKVKVDTIDDTAIETSETMYLKASANGSSSSGTGTILDNDLQPANVVGVTSTHASEGDPLVFTVNLCPAGAKPTAIALALANGSAAAGQDFSVIGLQASFDGGKTFVPINGNSVTVPAGASSFQVKVPGIEDSVFESTENFTLRASTSTSCAQGVGTICDDDVAIKLVSINSTQANEGDPLTFTIALSGANSVPAVVALALNNGTATAGQDFAATGLQVSFDGGKSFGNIAGSSVSVPAGVSGFQVRVPGLEDTVYEGNEKFTLQASSNGTTVQGIGTICENDQALRVVAVNSVQANEGEALLFTVGLSGVSSTVTTVQLQLANGTATAGQDFAASGLQVSFDGGKTFALLSGTSVSVPAGVSGFQVKVPGIDDSVYEGNENFTLQASTNGSNAQGIGTICENDGAVRVTSIDSVQANEGDPLTFTVGLSGISASATTVQLQLANGTATAGQDYASTGLQVSFDGGASFSAVTGNSVSVPAGVSGFKLRVAGLEDTIFEGNETFSLQASANGSSVQGIGTICEDDAAPRVVNVSSAAAYEGDVLGFEVTLSGASTQSTTVQLQLGNGTAVAGQDFSTSGLQVSFDGGATFSALTGTSVTVPAGITGFKVRVPSIEDSLVEADETFQLQASSNGASAIGIGTILNDDRPLDPNAIKIVGDTTIVEGTPAHVFSIKLGEAVTADTWVTVRINDGTANRANADGAGQDYVKDAATQSAWKAILPTASAGVGSLNKDFGVYGSDGQLAAGDTIRVLVHAGSSESETFSVKTWQELQRVAQVGSAFEGDEKFQITVVQAGSQTFSQPPCSTVTVVDAHIQQISPIIIDLNGDGVRTTSIEQSQASFDMDLDGVKDKTGWVSKEDGLLAVDSNRDGLINDRSELFGGNIGQGFAQLAGFDSNQDGQVNAGDERFAELKIWQDRDGDGTTDDGELVRLDQAGIASLRVNYQIQQEDQNGNMLLERSTAQFADGHDAEMADAYFAVQSGAQAPKLADLLIDSRDDEIPLANLIPTGSVGAERAAASVKPVEAGFESSVDLEHLLHKPQLSGD